MIADLDIQTLESMSVQIVILCLADAQVINTIIAVRLT